MSQVFHKSTMEELEKAKTAGKRPRDEADDSTTGVPCLKQPKLSFLKRSSVSQQHVDNLIMDYIVSEMKPLRTVETESIQDHLAYLNDKDKELHMLDRHVNVKPLFIRYNTTLPSSAPVERLFSSGAIILSKRRSRPSDTLFEKLLLLKVNKHCW